MPPSCCLEGDHELLFRTPSRPTLSDGRLELPRHAGVSAGSRETDSERDPSPPADAAEQRAGTPPVACLPPVGLRRKGSCRPGAGSRRLDDPHPHPTPSADAAPTRSPNPSPSDRPIIGATPPSWLGKRVLPRPADGFGEIGPTPPELVRRRFTLPDPVPILPGPAGLHLAGHHPGARRRHRAIDVEAGLPGGRHRPVLGTAHLRGLRRSRHTGELLVNKSVAADLVSVFRQLYAAKFPIEEMRITRADELDAPPTGDGNDTGAFNCRPTVGATSDSQARLRARHRREPVPEPLHQGRPGAAGARVVVRRSRVGAPGMIEPDGPVVRAFETIGWTWGGTWHSLKDLQHFSQNGT